MRKLTDEQALSLLQRARALGNAIQAEMDRGTEHRDKSTGDLISDGTEVVKALVEGSWMSGKTCSSTTRC